MTQETHYLTAPEDRISFFQKFIYGLGSLCNQLLVAAMSVLTIVFVPGLHMNPALAGKIMAIPRFIDALIDPLMGFITDKTKSKWGRRRPYIFIGALLSGIVFIVMWQIPENKTENYYFYFFAIWFIIYYIAYTVFAAPFVALGYEMTPDYHERTKLMSMSNTVGQFAWTLSPWLYPMIWRAEFITNFFNKVFAYFHLPESWKGMFIYKDMIDGTRHISIWMGIFIIIIGVLPAIFIKERYYKIATAEEKEKDTEAPQVSGYTVIMSRFIEFFKGFLITFKNLEFLKLCATMFLVFNGFQLIAGLGPFNINYYLFGGDWGKSATFMAWFFCISSIMTSIVIPFISWISSKLGKRRAFYIATSVAIFGYIIKWFCYTAIGNNSTEILFSFPVFGWTFNVYRSYYMFLCTPFIGFSLGGLFTLVGAMMADVCDQDELQTSHRREGLFGAVNWWVVKLGMALAFYISGYLLNMTGFKESLGGAQTEQALFLMRLCEVGIPIVTSLLAIFFIAMYQITEQKAHEIRQELEKRRGKANAV
ncbi:MAG: MFS transporter [Candidatus Aureabacteria bacterium]|nr:MFS transporter [Candidatus Auribacterota bacterium]